MKLFIVHQGTGTVLSCEECLLVPFSGEYNEEMILNIAQHSPLAIPLKSVMS